MATRESLKKLKVDALKKLAEELGITSESPRQKKCDLISSILTHQVPEEALTPVPAVTNRDVFQDCVTPCIERNGTDDVLPAFNKVHYRIYPLSGLPRISFSAIYNFMISRNKAGSHGSVENFKGLDKAVQHFDAGDVRNIKVSHVNDQVLYIKARCLASMKKDLYDVYLCLRVKDDTCATEYAFCQCPIGLAQCCSHIGALLIALNNKERLQEYDESPTTSGDKESRTSKLCKWIIPRNAEKQEPQPIRNMNIAKPKVEDPGERHTINFDPRNSNDRKPDYASTLQHLQELKQLYPQSGIIHLWDFIPDGAPDYVTECEVTTDIDPLHTKMEMLVYSPSNIPPLNIENDLVKYVEEQTRQQRDCEMWKALHKGRITSSLFGAVLKARNSPPQSLIKQIVEGSNLDQYSNLPPAVLWGVENETRARAEYIMFKGCTGDVEVKPAGLTLSSSHAFLGSSSDGRVIDNGQEGVLEIKCPYSLKGVKVNNMEIDNILNMNDSSFCLENSCYGPTLRKSHSYYAQVQGEMSLMGLPWCDFIVWTGAEKNNIFIERIWFDSDFVLEAFPKLVEFYVQHIFPRLS